LQANKALAQLPFNGKKTKPAKIRKDYWRPMAMIQFPEGLGSIGESVFQRLREFKRLHELSWGDELLYNDDGAMATRQERGKALNVQKTNAIADMAAVLGGAGGGNEMWRPATSGAGNAPAVKSTEVAAADGADGNSLLDVVVYWENDLLREHADKWPANVTHDLLSAQEQSKEVAAPEVTG
jgi:hypothetical protein